MYVPWQAGLIMGGALLALSLTIALLTRFFVQQRKANNEYTKQRTSKPAQDEVDTITHLGESIGASLGKHGIRTMDIMVAALVAGTILGASPELRKRLFGRKPCLPTRPRKPDS